MVTYEPEYIDKLWEEEGDLSKRLLVDTYSKIKGKNLPWDKYKKPLFNETVIEKIKNTSAQHDIPFELVSKLIIEIEKNKNYTRTTMVNKSFDRIINQGWLHFDSIEKGLQYED